MSCIQYYGLFFVVVLFFEKVGVQEVERDEWQEVRK